MHPGDNEILQILWAGVVGGGPGFGIQGFNGGSVRFIDLRDMKLFNAVHKIEVRPAGFVP